MAPNFSPKTLQNGAKTIPKQSKTDQKQSNMAQNGPPNRFKTVESEKNSKFLFTRLHGGAVASRRRPPLGRGRGVCRRCGRRRDGSKRAIYLSDHLQQLSVNRRSTTTIQRLCYGHLTKF